MAAPHVTGALAIARQMFPDAPGSRLTELVLATATDIGAVGIDEIYGWEIDTKITPTAWWGSLPPEIRRKVHFYEVPVNEGREAVSGVARSQREAQALHAAMQVAHDHELVDRLQVEQRWLAGKRDARLLQQAQQTLRVETVAA